MIAPNSILTINGGSSSIKCALYEVAPSLRRTLQASIERIGQGGTKLVVRQGQNQSDYPVKAGELEQAATSLIEWLDAQGFIAPLSAIGHRFVHGMEHKQAILIDEALLEELQKIHLLDPDHLPGEIALVKAFRQRCPTLPQVACFDTAFHATMPRQARILPLPRRFDRAGMQRYGFHGLSYSYILEKLVEVAGPEIAGGRLVLAHLGNGASLAAVRAGQSIDTTMGFTPVGGIPMGTRSGDIDPGAAWYMMHKEGLSPAQFNQLINHESGLLGMSETSADMRDLLDKESTDVRAAEAVAHFCYQVKKCIGAYVAALGGIDALVFTGGMGAGAPSIRSRICAGLGYLGFVIDERRNAGNEACISSADDQTKVFALTTDEEWMIAKSTLKILSNA